LLTLRPSSFGLFGLHLQSPALEKKKKGNPRLYPKPSIDIAPKKMDLLSKKKKNGTNEKRIVSIHNFVSLFFFSFWISKTGAQNIERIQIFVFVVFY